MFERLRQPKIDENVEEKMDRVLKEFTFDKKILIETKNLVLLLQNFKRRD